MTGTPPAPACAHQNRCDIAPRFDRALPQGAFALRMAAAIAIALSAAACSKQEPAPAGADLSASTSTAVAAPPAPDNTLATKICGVLKKMAPTAGQLAPIGAQAQLVMALAAAFNSDHAALQRVSVEIDEVADKACAAERQTLLAALKTTSLQEAVR